MRPYALVLLLGAAALVVPGVAVAEAPDRPLYVSLAGMWVSVQDAELAGPALSMAGAEAGFDGGWGVAAAVGYRVTRAIRLDGELSYRTNALDEVAGPGVAASVAGDLASLAGMANAYLDVFAEAPVQPYLGLGIGLARLTLDSDDLGADSESDTVLAYQGMVGLSGRLATALTLFGGYRYFATDDPRFEGVEAEYRTHHVEVGIRVAF